MNLYYDNKLICKFKVAMMPARRAIKSYTDCGLALMRVLSFVRPTLQINSQRYTVDLASIALFTRDPPTGSGFESGLRPRSAGGLSYPDRDLDRLCLRGADSRTGSRKVVLCKRGLQLQGLLPTDQEGADNQIVIWKQKILLMNLIGKFKVVIVQTTVMSVQVVFQGATSPARGHLSPVYTRPLFYNRFWNQLGVNIDPDCNPDSSVHLYLVLSLDSNPLPVVVPCKRGFRFHSQTNH